MYLVLCRFVYGNNMTIVNIFFLAQGSLIPYYIYFSIPFLTSCVFVVAMTSLDFLGDIIYQCVCVQACCRCVAYLLSHGL